MCMHTVPTWTGAHGVATCWLLCCAAPCRSHLAEYYRAQRSRDPHFCRGMVDPRFVMDYRWVGACGVQLRSCIQWYDPAMCNACYAKQCSTAPGVRMSCVTCCE